MLINKSKHSVKEKKIIFHKVSHELNLLWDLIVQVILGQKYSIYICCVLLCFAGNEHVNFMLRELLAWAGWASTSFPSQLALYSSGATWH